MGVSSPELIPLDCESYSSFVPILFNVAGRQLPKRVHFDVRRPESANRDFFALFHIDRARVLGMEDL